MKKIRNWDNLLALAIYFLGVAACALALHFAGLSPDEVGVLTILIVMFGLIALLIVILVND